MQRRRVRRRDAPPRVRPACLQVLFRSLHRLLMDTAAHEYLFCLEMWGDESTYRCAEAVLCLVAHQV